MQHLQTWLGTQPAEIREAIRFIMSREDWVANERERLARSSEDVARFFERGGLVPGDLSEDAVALLARTMPFVNVAMALRVLSSTDRLMMDILTQDEPITLSRLSVLSKMCLLERMFSKERCQLIIEILEAIHHEAH